MGPVFFFVIALDDPERFEIASALAFACGASGAENFFRRGREISRFYFADDRHARAAAGIWRERLGIATRIERLEAPEDPLAEFRAAARPREVGRAFWLVPGDVLEPAPAGRTALHLPASTAFGTGGHESTRLAIRLLEEETFRGARVLDVGAGSGVLALAASVLGASSVSAFDHDAGALFEARRNLARNPEAGRAVRLLVGDIEALRGEYDLVVANMLLLELSPLLSGVALRLGPGGCALFSGLLAGQRQEFAASCLAAGLCVEREIQEGEWIAVAARRG
jgi:ribosomal protein L11 methyltransferase